MREHMKASHFQQVQPARTVAKNDFYYEKISYFDSLIMWSVRHFTSLIFGFMRIPKSDKFKMRWIFYLLWWCCHHFSAKERCGQVFNPMFEGMNKSSRWIFYIQIDRIGKHTKQPKWKTKINVRAVKSYKSTNMMPSFKWVYAKYVYISNELH